LDACSIRKQIWISVSFSRPISPISVTSIKSQCRIPHCLLSQNCKCCHETAVQCEWFCCHGYNWVLVVLF
jgi:hypothetical protein